MAMRESWDYVAICDVQLVDETENAGLFLIEGEEVWLTWSQIDVPSVDFDGEDFELYVRRWLAEERDLPFVS